MIGDLGAAGLAPAKPMAAFGAKPTSAAGFLTEADIGGHSKERNRSK
jgi:hypothetical protein